ncbi:unnamed protein product, partial [Scytosiphon promiscuus]
MVHETGRRGSKSMAASQQIRQMLDQLEEEARREQAALRRRIDEESAEVKATMAFSRALAVKSVEQEMEFRKARETEEARLRSQKEKREAEEVASTTAPKPANLSSLSLSLPEPELEREDAEDDRPRLVEENRRLSDDNRRLAEEASALRVQGEERQRLAEEQASVLLAKEEEENKRLATEVCALREQVKEMQGAAASAAAASAAAGQGGYSCGESGRVRGSSSEPCVVPAAVALADSAPGSPADGQRPATPSPEEEVSGVVSVSSDSEDEVPGSGLGVDVGVARVTDPKIVAAVERAKKVDDSSGSVSGDVAGTPAPESAEHLQLVLFEPVPSSSRSRRWEVPAASARRGDGSGGRRGGSVGDRSRSCSSSSRSNWSAWSSRDGSFGSEREGFRGRRDEDEPARRTMAEVDRLIRIEAERVYTELRADPPPAVRALLDARKEMDGLAAEARSTLKGLNASVGFPPEQHQQ